MLFFLLLYLILALVRPQDYPDWIDAWAGIPVMPIVLALALLAWLMSRRAKVLDLPQHQLLLAFLLVMLASHVFNGWVGGAIAELGTFTPVMVTFLLMAHAASSQRDMRLLLVVFTLCATVLSLHGIDQVSSGIGWTGMELSQGTRIQYVGIFNDPNDLGMLFVMCLPMAFYLAKRGGLRRLFWWSCAGVLVYGIYLTDSRGTLLAFALLAALFIWRRWGKVAAVVFGSAGLTALMMLPSRLSELDAEEASAAGRIDAWYEGLQMFFSHPILGVGPGRFDDYHYMVAHNSYVHVLAETGFIGFTLWLAFVGYGFLMMTAILRHRPALADVRAAVAWNRDRAVASTLLLAQGAFFFAAFFLSRSYIVLLYMLAGLAAGHYMGVRQRVPSIPSFNLINDAIKWGAFSVGAIVFLYLLVRILLTTT